MFDIVTAIVIFFFGAIIGSFLNVVILRFRSGRTVGGRSICMSCSKTLNWFELIPIGSFLTQRGKCTKCKTPISWQYPLVEALTGILFVTVYARFAYVLYGNPLLFTILFAYGAFLVSILIILSVYDIKHKILPDRFVMLFSAVAFIGMFLFSGDALILHVPTLSQFLAGIILPLPFTALWYFSKGKWMGLGDAKLMIGIGFLLGVTPGIAALVLSFWIGALVSILVLLLAPYFGKSGVTFKTALPFGPFLALGTIITFVCQLDLGYISNLINGLWS